MANEQAIADLRAELAKLEAENAGNVESSDGLTVAAPVSDTQAATAADIASPAAFGASADGPTPEGVAHFAATTEHPLSHVEGAIAADVSDGTRAVDDAIAGVNDVTHGHFGEALAPAEDLVTEIHAMVTDIHQTIESIKPVFADFAPMMEKLSQSPLLKTLGL